MVKRLKKNGVAIITFIVAALIFTTFVYGLTTSVNETNNDKYIEDLLTLSGLSYEEIRNLDNVLKDTDTLRDNIFIYKSIIDIHKNISTDASKVYDLIGKYNINELLAVYEFVKEKELEFEELETILNEKEKGKELEELITTKEIELQDKEYKNYVPASVEQVHEWLTLNFTPEDIMNADNIARELDMPIEFILEIKTADDEWSEIEEELGYVPKTEERKEVKINIKKGEDITTLSGGSISDVVEQVNKNTKKEKLALTKELKKQGYDINKYVTEGFNIEEVKNAVRLSEESGKPIEEILEAKKSCNSWEQVIKEYSKKEEANNEENNN